MGSDVGFGTALFIVAVVFLVLVSLWLLLRFMSAVVMKFESLIKRRKSDSVEQHNTKTQ